MVTKAKRLSPVSKSEEQDPCTGRPCAVSRFMSADGCYRCLLRARLPRYFGVASMVGRNYNVGVTHFPEIEYDKVDALRGLNIITTTADDEVQGAARGLPFPVPGQG